MITRKLFGAALLACLSTTSVSAQQFGVLNEVIFLEPEHDGMSTWSVADPTRIETQLTADAEGPLAVNFEFDFSPNGNHFDLGFVLPTFTDGLTLHCDNYKRNYFDSTDISFGRCALTDAWLQTIDEPKTIELTFLGGGGTNSSVQKLIWEIEPFDLNSQPLKIDTITLTTPVLKLDTRVVEFKLSRPAPRDGITVRVGYAPTECFNLLQSAGSSGFVSANDGLQVVDGAIDPDRLAPISNRETISALRHPVYAFEDIFFAEGDLTHVSVIGTTDCVPTSFSIHTWADRNIANFGEDNYTFREGNFVVPQ